MLDYTHKYNWWTPAEKKADISLESKIEYCLQYGTLKELKRMIAEVGTVKVKVILETRFEHKTPKYPHIVGELVGRA